MAFVYEELTEQDKEFVDSFKFPRPLSGYTTARAPYEWVADRERGIFLICLGGQGRTFDQQYPPNFYRLIWNDIPIKIEARVVLKGNNTIGLHFSIAIERIVAPDTIDIKPEILTETIKEAFISKEKRPNRNILSIEFIEVEEPEFIKGDVNNG